MTAKQHLLVFQLVTSLFWFSMFTYVPLLSTYIHVLHGSTFITGIIIGLYGFTQMLVRIPLGIWADRVLRRKPFIIAGLALATFSSLGLALTHSISWLFVTQIVNGFGQGLCMPMLMGLAIRDVAPDRRATAMGIYQAVYALGMFGGPFLAGGVGNLINLNASFYTVSLISLMAMILTYRWTPKEDIPFLT